LTYGIAILAAFATAMLMPTVGASIAKISYYSD
jgi:hypothetical protein